GHHRGTGRREHHTPRRQGRADPDRPRPDRSTPRAVDLAHAGEVARRAQPPGAPRPVQVPATAGEVIMSPHVTRRRFLSAVAAGPSATAAGLSTFAQEKRKALVAITLDLEMSAEYPKRGMTEWNYRKGDLDADTKKYAVGAAKVAKDRGGRIHFFAVG